MLKYLPVQSFPNSERAVLFKFPDVTTFFLTRGILRRTRIRNIHGVILRRTCEKKCPNPKFSTINLTRSGRGRELVLGGETPAANCLNHCAVRSLERAVLSTVPDFRKNIAFWKVSRLCHLSFCWQRVCGDYGVLLGLLLTRKHRSTRRKTCSIHLILGLSNIVHNNSVPTKQRTWYVTKTNRLMMFGVIICVLMQESFMVTSK